MIVRGITIRCNTIIICNESNIYLNINKNCSEQKEKYIGIHNISIGTHNIYIGTHNVWIGTHNIYIGTQNIYIGTHNIYIGTHNIYIGTFKNNY